MASQVRTGDILVITIREVPHTLGEKPPLPQGIVGCLTQRTPVRPGVFCVDFGDLGTHCVYYRCLRYLKPEFGGLVSREMEQGA